MNGTNHIGNDTVLGTIGGTLLATVPHLDSTELTKTLMLGGIGAVVSFIVTQSCKWLWNKLRIKCINRHKNSDTKIKKNDKN